MALTTNIVAYRKFDESSGTAADSVNGHNASISGSASYTTGKINNGADLSGGYFGASDSTDFDFGTGEVSVAARVYQNSLANYQYVINQRQGNGKYGAQRALHTQPGSGAGDSMNFYIYNGSSGLSASSTNGSHSAGVREFWVGTRNGTSMKIYKNGVLNNSTTGTAINADNNGTVSIGTNIGQGNARQGKIDEVGIWKYELTAGEILSLYNGGAGLQYPFTTPTAVKSANGVLKNNIKSKNGTVNANIKSRNGVA